ncbi:MAG: hypothetical protein PW734_07755 [Verrucomicrobium sp.]|nr:hypothetical protein [Verrucomicrobium sp.]
MAFISVEEAKAGLVLEDSVKNSHGQLLVAAGTTLTERHLTLLRSWGVTQVPVSASGAAAKELADSQQLSQENLAKAETSLLEIFSLAQADDPVMQEIYRQCVARKAKLAPSS